MVFRVKDTLLYRVKINIANEDLFIGVNNNDYNSFIIVAEEDLPTTSINASEVFYKYDANNVIVVDEYRTNAKYEEDVAEEKLALFTELQNVCDFKTQEVLNFLAGQNVTTLQIDRYSQKAAMAKAYKADNVSYKDELSTEATLVGLSVDDLASLIIQLSDASNTKTRASNSLIEAFRVKTKYYIVNNDFLDARKAIYAFKALPDTFTADDITNIFK